MAKFHVCLICHAEYGAANDDSTDAETVFREWVPRFTEALDSLERELERRIPVTWCCGAYHDRESLQSGKVLCAEHFPDEWAALRERGDEIGLHSHGPEVSDDETGLEGCWAQHMAVPGDIERMVSLGFESPKTYIPGFFLWRDELAQTLIDAGVEASSTVMALPGKHAAWVGLFDYLKIPIETCLLETHQPSSYPFRPYRVSATGMGDRGDSELVELPVIGYLGKWDFPDFENSAPCDLTTSPKKLRPKNWIAEGYLAFENERHLAFPSLRQRWEMRYGQDVDIWPTFFHPYEMNHERLERTVRLVRELSSWDDVEFSTSIEAVRDWKGHNLTSRT